EQLRRATAIRMEEAFERARTVEVNGATFRTTDPADTLIHLAVHACLAGGGRLIWMRDLEQAVVNDRPAWADVIARATAWRVDLLVGQMLLRSRQLLSTPVPDEVLRALVPGTLWRGIVGSLDRVFPITGWTRRETPAVRLAESMRPGVRETLGFITATPLRRARARGRSAARPGDDGARPAYLELAARITDVLDAVGLADVRDRVGFALSSGMRARLQLACALLHQPPVLILDEPTGTVDPIGSFELLEQIRQVTVERKLAVLFSTHRVDEIDAIGEIVDLIHRGREVHAV